MPAFSTEISATEHQYLRENDKVTIGIPFPDTYIKIVEPGTDCELPYGEKSEILLAGPTVKAESIP